MRISDFFDIFSLHFILIMFGLWAIFYIGFILAEDLESAAAIVRYFPQFCLEILVINIVRVLILKGRDIK